MVNDNLHFANYKRNLTRHASACHYEMSTVIYAQPIVRIGITPLLVKGRFREVVKNVELPCQNGFF